MGCAQSKIEHEEGVTRCKERKELMKKGVASRNAFAAAHSAYAVSLRNTGAALSDYGQGEVHLIIPPSLNNNNNNQTTSSSSMNQPSSSVPSSSIPSTSSSATPIVIQPPIDNPLPPPPPPLPDYKPAQLQRAASMPDFTPIPKKQPKPPIDDSIREEDGDADDEDETEDDDEEEQEAASRLPRPPPTTAPTPSMSTRHAAGEWLSDYIFDTENMPVPSLSQPETPPPVPAPPSAQETVMTEPPPPPSTPAAAPLQKEKLLQVKKHKSSAAAGGSGGDRESNKVRGGSVNLLHVLEQLDNHFLAASESAHDVSKMLEATRMHYHSNFADNRGHIDHSARIMRVITWNRSCKNLKDENGGDEDFDNDDLETHATILDKMLAWEKKLYDEVKAGELMKIDYQRKVASLNKQKKRGASVETLERTKAAVSHLHTRYIVDMQSMDSTVSEINSLRDTQLYPKLVELVDGMATMWQTMHMHHSSQFKIAGALRNLNISLAPKETTEQHFKRTEQLAQVLFEWHARFQNLIKYQKEHIQTMNSWLKLNLIPIESNLKEKVSSPPRPSRPPIQPLLHAWNDLLEKLPDDRTRGVIHTFSEVVKTILIIQEDELKLKDKCEGTRREYMKRRRAFDEWYQKYSEKKAAEAAAAAAAAAADEPMAAANEDDNADMVTPGSREREHDEILEERKGQVEGLLARLKEEEDTYHRTCKQVREKSVGSLKTHLPELFRALSDFAHDCSEMYKRLRSIATSDSQETGEVG